MILDSYPLVMMCTVKWTQNI